jgi:hypothetical protein
MSDKAKDDGSALAPVSLSFLPFTSLRKAFETGRLFMLHQARQICEPHDKTSPNVA